MIATFSGNPGLQEYEGQLHGRVISSLLDAAMTHCLFHHGIEAVTGELYVRFVFFHPPSLVEDERSRPMVKVD